MAHARPTTAFRVSQKPLLLYWAIVVSLKSFGLTTAAVRLPIALATLAAVAFTFLIGDRLGGPWRGFLAGLIHLCCCGTFLFGRIVMPEPVFSAFIAGAIYCAIRGYERRQGRRRLVHWFLDFRRACLHDEQSARARFTRPRSSVCSPVFIVKRVCGFVNCCAGMAFSIFLLIAAPWHIWLEWRHPGFPRPIHGPRMARASGRRDRSRPQLRQRAAPRFPRAPSRLVVPVDGRDSARRFPRLAARFSSARNRVCRCPPALLDGRGLHPALRHRSATGLLFDEHVGRLRDLRRDRLGTDAALDQDRRRLRRARDRPRRRLRRVAFAGALAQRRRPMGRDRGALHGLAHPDAIFPISTWLGFRSMFVVTRAGAHFFLRSSRSGSSGGNGRASLSPPSPPRWCRSASA